MADNWKIFAKRTFALEKKFLPLIRKAIVSFRSSFIDQLHKHGLQHTLQRLTLPQLNAELPIVIDRLYRDAGLMGAKLQHAELKAAAKQKAAGFGQNEQWILEVINYLKLHLLEISTKITDTMREDILKVLTQAIEEGWSIERTVLELKRDDIVEARARVIARTEINTAANMGHKVAAQSFPYEVDKGWSAAKDHRTRHSHRDVDGHTTSEEGTFKVPIYKGNDLIGHEDMEGPGDPKASAANRINCRCRRIYIAKRDSQGKLILRRSTTATIIPIGANQSTSVPVHQIAAALKANIFIGVKMDDVTE